MLIRFQNSTSMLFYVKKAALPVNPNKVLTIDIGEDDHSSSSSTHINKSYNKRYGSADASSELNVAEKLLPLLSRHSSREELFYHKRFWNNAKAIIAPYAKNSTTYFQLI